MKYLIFCVLITVAAGEANANYARLSRTFAMGTRVSISSRAATPTCTHTGPQCAADCSTLMICAENIATPLTTTNCSSPNQYCVGNACTSQPSVNCTTAPAFTCTADGVFPEPENCTQYRVCSGVNATLYQCPPGFVFDSVNNICAASTARTLVPTLPCNTINCAKSPNAFIVYPSNPAYYAYCSLGSTGQITTYMFACPYQEFQIFDPTSSQCTYNCLAKGNFQNPADCNSYYYCTAAKAKPTLLSCEPTYVFDGTGCNANNATCEYPPSTTEAPATTVAPPTS